MDHKGIFPQTLNFIFDNFLFYFHPIPESLKLCGVPPGGGALVGGATCLYEGHIYFEELQGQVKIYILIVTLLG
jgi:hypothetical protein